MRGGHSPHMKNRHTNHFTVETVDGAGMPSVFGTVEKMVLCRKAVPNLGSLRLGTIFYIAH